MTKQEDPKDRPAGRAGHGYSNEVKWDGGQGRQPYSNQGSEESEQPNLELEDPEGNRGAASGTNLDQLEQVKKKP